MHVMCLQWPILLRVLCGRGRTCLAAVDRPCTHPRETGEQGAWQLARVPLKSFSARLTRAIWAVGGGLMQGAGARTVDACDSVRDNITPAPAWRQLHELAPAALEKLPGSDTAHLGKTARY